MTQRSFYRDFLLSCQPLRQDGGRYQARVAITSLGGDKTRSQRFVDFDETFASETEAIAFARQSGMDWVDANHRSL